VSKALRAGGDCTEVGVFPAGQSKVVDGVQDPWRSGADESRRDSGSMAVTIVERRVLAKDADAPRGGLSLWRRYGCSNRNRGFLADAG